MYSFDDNAAVTATLERMAAREEPLTVLMARQPGSREARWAHLLSGVVEVGASASVQERVRESGTGAPALVQRVEALEELVRSLEERLKTLEDCGVFSRE